MASTLRDTLASSVVCEELGQRCEKARVAGFRREAVIAMYLVSLLDLLPLLTFAWLRQNSCIVGLLGVHLHGERIMARGDLLLSSARHLVL